MAIDFSIAPHAALIVTRFTDLVSSSELVEAYKAIYAHSESKPGFSELLILNEKVVLDLRDEAMAEVVKLTTAFHESGGASSRAAIVMPDYFDHAIAKVFRQFAELTAKSHSQVLTCFDLKQAAHWLNIDVGDVMP